MAVHYIVYRMRLLFVVWMFSFDIFNGIHANLLLYFTRRQNIFTVCTYFLFSSVNVALWMYCDSTCQFQLNNKFQQQEKKERERGKNASTMLNYKKRAKSIVYARSALTRGKKREYLWAFCVQKPAAVKIKWSNIQQQNHAPNSNWRWNDKVCAH